MRSYEGVLPGMVPVVWMKDTPLQWIAELKSRGYEITPSEVYKPEPDFPGSASCGATFAPARFAAADSATAFLTDEVIKYLSVRQDEPWFVHLSYLSPRPSFGDVLKAIDFVIAKDYPARGEVNAIPSH